MSSVIEREGAIKRAFFRKHLTVSEVDFLLRLYYHLR